ncbi:hypothetical protein AB0D57_32100 [Streptomyces sp. NPDC048275]|uniref:hypothetical protein n=1 Tax=Streptomyces sp. NPDC048275 TaxID=3155629 RepID=UPI0033C2751B
MISTFAKTIAGILVSVACLGAAVTVLSVAPAPSDIKASADQFGNPVWDSADQFGNPVWD